MRQILGLVVASACAGVASANVINGGFELPDLGFRTVASGQTYGDWTNLGPGDIEFVQAVPHPILNNLQFSAHEGEYWIDLVGVGRPSAIAQDLTGLVPGAQYRINWAQAGNVWGSDFAFTMQVVWNGVVVAENTQVHGGSDGRQMNWQERYVDVTANLTAGPNQLIFRATTGGSNRGAALDSVSIEAIPAPGAAALLGLAGLAVARRDRRVYRGLR
jgi:hypothetical protein